jgi:hypothetical protein
MSARKREARAAISSAPFRQGVFVLTDSIRQLLVEVLMLRRSWLCFVSFGVLTSLGACRSTDATQAGDGGGANEGGSAGSATEGGSADSAGSAGEGGSAGNADSAVVSQNASFFVTSAGSTDGGNLGGLVGADMRCQAAAAQVGLGGKTWHAYLSLSARDDGSGAVNARDRIGSGPWYNVRGVLIATDVGALHEEGGAGMNGITSATGLDEHGNIIPSGDANAGIAPEHDILTGSTADGRAFPSVPDYTCSGWTSDQAGPPLALPTADASAGAGGTVGDQAGDAASAGTDGTSTPAARVGHVNRVGSAVCPFCAAGTPLDPSSWNSAHPTPGCAQADLVEVGGIGRLYCFAIN